MEEYTLIALYHCIYHISTHLEMHIETMNNPKKPLGMNNPEIRATLATRHKDKQNKKIQNRKIKTRTPPKLRI